MPLLRHLPRFRRARRLLAAFEARESWPRADITQLQLTRLNAVWGHAIRHVPHYRALRQRLDLPPRFDSLHEYQDSLPVLTKEHVRSDGLSLLSERREPGGWKWTSGSTGKPMRFYWGNASHRHVLSARYRFYASWGIDHYDRTVFVWGAEQGRGLGRLREQALDRLRNRLRVPAYRLDAASLRQAAQRVAAFDPRFIYGLGHAVDLLAVEAAEIGAKTDNVGLVVVTGEPAGATLAKRTRLAFGAPTAVEYGATECHLIAGQAPDGTLRVREDVALVETAPREDGRYDILLTVLGNPSYPLLRYRIEDTVDAPLEKPETGFAILPALLGRAADVLKASDGRIYHPARVDKIFESDRLGRVVRRYRIDQHEDGSIVLRLEPIWSLSAVDQRFAQAEVERLSGDYPVRVEVVDRMTDRFKHRGLVSALQGAGG